MRKISTFVIAIHCAIILWMAWIGFHTKEIKKTRLVIRTVSAAPKVTQKQSTPIAAAKSAATVAPPAPVQAAAKPAPAQSPPKPVAVAPQPAKPLPQKKGLQTSTPKKNPPAKPKTPEPSAPPAATVELLKQLEQSLAKMEQPQASTPSSPAKKQSAFSAPTLKIDHLVGDEEEGDAGYESQLITFLHNSLNLPEFGEVKMKLTLQNNGTCVKMQVIRAQSAKNRRYLEEQLPKLRLPSFIGMLASKKEQTFVVTFCNE